MTENHKTLPHRRGGHGAAASVRMLPSWVLCGLLLACASASPAWALNGRVLQEAVAQQELILGARIGMAVIETSENNTWAYRGHERFALNSTHKALTCGWVLKLADAGILNMDKPRPLQPLTWVPYSPVTEKRTPGPMSLRELCQASVSVSDNTAANEVVQAGGGPAAFTTFMRSIGDDTTRLDRMEPDLNDNHPDDVRDSTTPIAVASSVRALLLGPVLSVAARQTLTQWMLDDQVANDLLRAGLPKAWRIADKSGAGSRGSRSIVAVVWPSQKAPVVVAIYVTDTEASMAARNRAIAQLATALVEALRHE